MSRFREPEFYPCLALQLQLPAPLHWELVLTAQVTKLLLPRREIWTSSHSQFHPPFPPSHHGGHWVSEPAETTSLIFSNKQLFKIKKKQYSQEQAYLPVLFSSQLGKQSKNSKPEGTIHFIGFPNCSDVFKERRVIKSTRIDWVGKALQFNYTCYIIRMCKLSKLDETYYRLTTMRFRFWILSQVSLTNVQRGFFPKYLFSDY